MSKSPKDTKGPVVKTGPTKGQNRSRNDDGSWRAKRSDAGQTRTKDSSTSKGSGKKGCFITTAACQQMGLSDDCYQLTTLRAFRDGYLSSLTNGKDLVADYYRIAPALAPLVAQAGIGDFVWKSIENAVSQIERGENEAALSTYQEMVKALQDAKLG